MTNLSGRYIKRCPLITGKCIASRLVKQNSVCHIVTLETYNSSMLYVIHNNKFIGPAPAAELQVYANMCVCVLLWKNFWLTCLGVASFLCHNQCLFSKKCLCLSCWNRPYWQITYKMECILTRNCTFICHHNNQQ